MLKQLENAIYLFADLTKYYRSATIPNGFGMIFNSADRTTADQAALRSRGAIGAPIAVRRSNFISDPFYQGYDAAIYGGDAFRDDEIPINTNLPVAPPGTSQHEYGAAFDAQPNVAPGLQQEALTAAGRIAAQCGLVWGGAADRVHFALFARDVWRQILPTIASGLTTARDLGALWEQMHGAGGAGADPVAPAGGGGTLHGFDLPGYASGRGSRYMTPPDPGDTGAGGWSPSPPAQTS